MIGERQQSLLRYGDVEGAFAGIAAGYDLGAAQRAVAVERQEPVNLVVGVVVRIVETRVSADLEGHRTRIQVLDAPAYGQRVAQQGVVDAQLEVERPEGARLLVRTQDESHVAVFVNHLLKQEVACEAMLAEAVGLAFDVGRIHPYASHIGE